RPTSKSGISTHPFALKSNVFTRTPDGQTPLLFGCSGDAGQKPNGQMSSCRTMAAPFGKLLYLYVGTSDFDRDLKYYTAVLGASVLWSHHAFGAKVAALRLCDGPQYLLADHRSAPSCLPLFEVQDLKAKAKELRSRGWVFDRCHLAAATGRGARRVAPARIEPGLRRPPGPRRDPWVFSEALGLDRRDVPRRAHRCPRERHARRRPRCRERDARRSRPRADLLALPPDRERPHRRGAAVQRGRRGLPGVLVLGTRGGDVLPAVT